MSNITITHHRIVDYVYGLELQRDLHCKVSEGILPEQLLLLEHPHIYTLGRLGKDSDILLNKAELSELGIQTHRTDRGGQVTYHGPGQLVGYPIVNLRRLGWGPLQYVRALEKSLISTLAKYFVNGKTANMPTGVWVKDSKIAAIGVKISKGVTTHGFSLNVNTNLSYFNHIVPCGIPDAKVTSMATELSNPVPLSEVASVMGKCLAATLGLDIER